MGSYYYIHCVDKEIRANKDYTGAREMPWTGRETLEDCAAVHGVRLDCQPFLPGLEDGLAVWRQPALV